MKNNLRSVYRNLFESLDPQGNKPKILLLQGPAGSGKSFFAKELVSSNPNIHYVNVDDYVEERIMNDSFLKSRGITVQNAFSARHDRRTQDVLEYIRKSATSKGLDFMQSLITEKKSFIVEGTGQRRYTDIVNNCADNNYELLYLSVYAPLEFTIDSNRKRATENGRQLSEYLLKKIHDGYVQYYQSMKSHFSSMSFCTYFETVTMLEIMKDVNQLKYPQYMSGRVINIDDLDSQEVSIINNINKTKEVIKSELISKM